MIFMPHSHHKIAIPYFHSVQPQPDKTWSKSYLTLQLQVFEQFLALLKRQKWQTLFLDEMYEMVKSGRAYKGKYCVLTFDDGYADNYIFVYPLLKQMGMKGTIFVSPECIDRKRVKAKTLFDVWEGRAKVEELPLTAYLSQDELVAMQNSGVIDIQSHTMTHTKYFSSERLVSFHHKGADSVHQINNQNPELRAYYFNYKDCEKLIPYGTPKFEEKSAVVTKRHWVNPDFNQEVVALLADRPYLQNYNFALCYENIRPVYQKYMAKSNLFSQIETDDEYQKRISYEIAESKAKLESLLNKPVNYLCWPHGENNEAAQMTAVEAGYKAATRGKAKSVVPGLFTFERFGISYRKNMVLSKLLWSFKLRAQSGRMPQAQIKQLINIIR